MSFVKTITDPVKAKIQATGRYLSASKKRQRLTGVVMVLACAAAGQIVYLSFAATTEYSPIPQVAKMQKLTEEVIQDTKDYAAMPDTISSKKGAAEPNAAKTTKKQALITKVKERKDAYKVAIQYDPQTTANFYLPEETRVKLPGETKQDLEQARVIKGFWTTLIAETGVTTDPQIQPVANQFSVYITDSTNTDTYMYGNNLPSIQSGTQVTTLGIAVDDVMAMTLPNTQALQSNGTTTTSFLRDMLQPQAHAQIITVDPSPGAAICKIPEVADFLTSFMPGDGLEIIAEKCNDALNHAAGKVLCDDKKVCGYGTDAPSIKLTGSDGQRKALIVQVRFSNEPNTDRSTADLKSAGDIAQDFYFKASYGKFKPAYDVYDKSVTLSIDNLMDCQKDAMAVLDKATRKAVKDSDAGKKLLNSSSQYTDVVYAYRSLPNCEKVTDKSGNSTTPSFPSIGWAAFGGSRGDSHYIGSSHVFLADSKQGGRGDFKPQYIASLISHEQGHSYGLGHAAGACNAGAPPDNSAQFDLSKYCTSAFNDSAHGHTIMGGADIGNDAYDFNFYHKSLLGWVDDGDLYQLANGGSGSTYKLNALYKGSGKRAISFEYDSKKFFIEYRPNSSLSPIDKFTVGVENPGLLVYYQGEGDQGEQGKTHLLGSIHWKASDNNWYWDYRYAAQTQPFKIGDGDNTVCITPSDLTEESVEVQIDRDCSKVKTGAYHYDSQFAGPGSADNQLASSPGHITIDSKDNVYVAETVANEVKKFDSTGKFITKWGGTYGTADNQFENTGALAVDSKGNVYVGDNGNSVIKKFSSNGAFISKILPGRAPTDIVFDSQDNMYIAYDYSVGNRGMIQEFDSSGNFIKGWGSYKTFDPVDGQFSVIGGLALDKQNNVYALDASSQAPSVQKFDAKGNFIKKWGTIGNGTGQFSVPMGITFGSQGTLYVSNRDNGRIQEFSTDGKLVSDCLCGRAWDGAYGTGFMSLGFTANGDMLVADGRSKGSINRYTRTAVETKDYLQLAN